MRERKARDGADSGGLGRAQLIGGDSGGAGVGPILLLDQGEGLVGMTAGLPSFDAVADRSRDEEGEGEEENAAGDPKDQAPAPGTLRGELGGSEEKFGAGHGEGGLFVSGYLGTGEA